MDRLLSPSTAFRAGAGIVVINDAGLVLALERARIPGAWQLPQGGLLEGEEPLEAAYRELLEETGIPRDQVVLIAEHPDWLAYELPEDKRTPKKGRGQALKWFLFRWQGSEAAINLGREACPEFRAWQWMKLPELAASTVSFRRPIYEKLLSEFAAWL